jgi:hypothetical protein
MTSHQHNNTVSRNSRSNHVAEALFGRPFAKRPAAAVGAMDSGGVTCGADGLPLLGAGLQELMVLPVLGLLNILQTTTVK